MNRIKMRRIWLASRMVSQDAACNDAFDETPVDGQLFIGIHWRQNGGGGYKSYRLYYELPETEKPKWTDAHQQVFESDMRKLFIAGTLMSDPGFMYRARAYLRRCTWADLQTPCPALTAEDRGETVERPDPDDPRFFTPKMQRPPQ